MTNKQLQVIEFYKGYYAKEAKEGNHGKRWINNRVNKVIDKMEKIQESIQSDTKVERIEIFISWTKSGTCKATTMIFKNNGFQEYQTKAGGYGYDKVSSVVGEAFNQDIDMLALLYKNYDTNKEEMPYGINDLDGGLSYGQGVGMSCYSNFIKWFNNQDGRNNESILSSYDNNTGNKFFKYEIK